MWSVTFLVGTALKWVCLIACPLFFIVKYTRKLWDETKKNFKVEFMVMSNYTNQKEKVVSVNLDQHGVWINHKNSHSWNTLCLRLGGGFPYSIFYISLCGLDRNDISPPRSPNCNPKNIKLWISPFKGFIWTWFEFFKRKHCSPWINNISSFQIEIEMIPLHWIF